MLASEVATMVESSNKMLQFWLVPNTKKTKKVKESIIVEVMVHHSFHYPMRILMNDNDPGAYQKFIQTYVQPNHLASQRNGGRSAGPSSWLCSSDICQDEPQVNELLLEVCRRTARMFWQPPSPSMLSTS